MFRLIVDEPAGGPWNMAVDEALMENAGVVGSAAVIRLYSFETPTLSVGRFQPTTGIIDFSLLETDHIHFIRRPSGGQAVLHSRELTYSVAIGRHHLGGLSKRAVYRTIVPALLGGLHNLSIAAAEAKGASVSQDPDCFAAAGEYEIDGNAERKLIGSAQMVTRTSVLQHGSIPLDRANRGIYRYILGNVGENDSTSLSEELGREVTLAEAMAAFAKGASEVLGAGEDSLTEAETARAVELLAERYGRAEWNEKY